MDDAAAFKIVVDVDNDADFEVWDDNWDIVMMFLRLQTQWTVTMGAYVGLKYESLQWLVSLYSVEDRASLFEGIQVMESAALKELNNHG